MLSLFLINRVVAMVLALTVLVPCGAVKAGTLMDSISKSPSAISPPAGIDADAAPLPQNVEQGWWSATQRQIRDEEYQITSQNDGLQAPNRAHNLRTWFDESGALTTSRDATSHDSSEWQWGLQLERYGWKDSELSPVGPAAPQADKNTVTYQRGESLREWYVNDSNGLKSWFRVERAPSGVAGATLRLELSVRGNTQAGMGADGRTVEFISPGGVRVINYGGLIAFDATGRELVCHLGLEGTELAPRIVLDIDASGITFPLTIDPLATSAAWTAEGNQGWAYFGNCVASAGDVNGDGYSDVIVGALLYDNGEVNEGRVFVYLGSQSGLSSTAVWTAEGNQGFANFGGRVASAGDVNGDGYSDVIVAASYYDNGETDEGRAYVYLGSSSGLDSTAAWTAEGNQASAFFGESVATAGDVNGDGYSDVIIGAYGYDNGDAGEGAVFVYLGSQSGLTSTAAWTAESNQSYSYFGARVASAGDVNGDGYSDVIVGAYGYDNGEAEEGCAFVYLGSASGLTSTAAWTAEGNQEWAIFGVSVASAGDVNGDGYSDVIVGARRYDNGETDEGRAFVYMGSPSGLASTAAWTAEGDKVDAYLGMSVASAGDVNGDGYSDVIIGAIGYDNGEIDEGRAFVYFGSPSGLASSAAWTAEGNQSFAYFGISVASAGDVNGDGYSDVIVGAYGYDNGEADEGRAFVYYGGAGLTDNFRLNAVDFNPAAPDSAQPGSPLALTSWNITGVSTSAPVWLELFASTTGGFTLSRFGGTITNSYMLNGYTSGTSTFTPSQTLNWLPDGIYTVVGFVNRPGTGGPSETNYADNWVPIDGKRLRVHNTQLPNCNLVLENPTFTREGTSVTVSGTVRNTGPSATPDYGFWIETAYGSLSAESNFLQSGYIGGGVKVGRLEPNGVFNYSQTGTATVNATLAIMADSTDIIPETEEQDNWTFDGWLPEACGSTIDVGFVDAYIESTQLAPVELSPSDKLNLTFSVINRSSVDSGEMWVEFFASQTGGLSTLRSGVPLLQSTKINVAANSTANYNLDFNFEGIPDGIYSVVGIVNRCGVGDNPGDTSPSDNLFRLPGRVILKNGAASTANLRWIGKSVSVSPSKVTTINVNIMNSGTGLTRAFWTEAFYGLIDNKTGEFTPHGQISGGVLSAPLSTGETTEVTITGTIPAGTWVIGVISDSTDLVPETDEIDNWFLHVL